MIQSYSIHFNSSFGKSSQLNELVPSTSIPKLLQAALEKLHQLPAASAKTWTKTSEAYGEQFKDHNITALVEGKHLDVDDVGFLGLWDLGDGHLLVLRCQRKWGEIVG